MKNKEANIKKISNWKGGGEVNGVLKKWSEGTESVFGIGVTCAASVLFRKHLTNMMFAKIIKVCSRKDILTKIFTFKFISLGKTTSFLYVNI